MSKLFDGNSDYSKSKSRWAYGVCRKLAILHPTSVLRYVMRLGELVEGRCHLAPTEFVHRHYHNLFHHIINILHLLTPFLFLDVCLFFISSKIK